MDIDKKIIEIQEFVDRGNFHAAYNIALSAMNECVRKQDQAGVERFIAVIRKIVQSLEQRFSHRETGETKEQ